MRIQLSLIIICDVLAHGSFNTSNVSSKGKKRQTIDRINRVRYLDDSNKEVTDAIGMNNNKKDILPNDKKNNKKDTLPKKNTLQPTRNPTNVPSLMPSERPLSAPSSVPSPPTYSPTSSPSSVPYLPPTYSPTSVPSSVPSLPPTSSPSDRRSVLPTQFPSKIPTEYPSSSPTVTTVGGTKDVFDDNNERGRQSGCVPPIGAATSFAEESVVRITATFQYILTATEGSDLNELLTIIEDYIHDEIFVHYINCPGANDARVLSNRMDTLPDFPIGVSSLPRDKQDSAKTCASPTPSEICEVIDGSVTLLFEKDASITRSEAQKYLLNFMTLSASNGEFKNIDIRISRLVFLDMGQDTNTEKLDMVIAPINDNDQSVSRRRSNPLIVSLLSISCVAGLIMSVIVIRKLRRKETVPVQTFENSKFMNIYEIDELTDFGEKTVPSSPSKSKIMGEDIDLSFSEHSNESQPYDEKVKHCSNRSKYNNPLSSSVDNKIERTFQRTYSNSSRIEI